MTEQDAALESFVINDQRSGYTPKDREAYIYNLYQTTGLSTRKLAARLGVHHSTIDHYLEAHRFRQKLPAYLVGTLPLSSTALKQTAGIKDDNLRIDFLKALHDKRIRATEIATAAEVLSKVPREAREAFFRRLMTLEEIELYLIKNSEFMERQHKRLEELDKKLKEGKITKEEHDAAPINNESLVLMPTLKSSELLDDKMKARFIMSAELITEDRFTPSELKKPKVQKYLEEGRTFLQEKCGYGRLELDAMAEWGQACKDGVIQATEDIEDYDLRMRTVELVVDFRFAKWIQRAFKAETTVMQDD